MKRSLIACAVVLLVSTPLYAATTVQGRVNASTERVWSYVPFEDGQTLITLTWGKRRADLFVLLTCTTGAETNVFGVGAAFQDLLQRIESGVIGEFCQITVASFGGSSSFRLSVESGAPDDLERLLQAGGQAAVPGGGKLRLIPMQVSDFPGLAEVIDRYKAMGR